MSQFDEGNSTKPAGCAVCEAMLPDAVDGVLSEPEQRAFDKHVAGCVTCARELEEAQRGAAWMAMLKGHAPEPPAALLQRILAETTGAIAVAPSFFASPLTRDEAASEWATQTSGWATPAPVWATQVPAAEGWATRLRRSVAEAFSFKGAGLMFQPRLAMTAAMAFFSIALTMNLAGVRVTDVERGIAQPSSLRRTVADAGASAKRSFQNLRVVYEVESRVSDMRNTDGLRDNRFDDQGMPGALDHSKSSAQPESAVPDAGQKAAPANKQDKTVPQGSSELQMPVSRSSELEKGI